MDRAFVIPARHEESVTRLSALVAQVIAWTPGATLRRLAYRMLLGYRIDRGARIGFGTYICVERAEIGNCQIGRFNRFVGPMRIRIADGARIGARNRFDCGDWAARIQPAGPPYARSLHVGSDAVITGQHLFDVVGSLHFGNRTWVAGAGSQFWTHGVGAKRRDIHIGDDCYIGSAARFTPGSSVASGSIVGVGSVVTKSFEQPDAFLAGVPARFVNEATCWQAQRAVQQP